jgi:hypothetical protein
MKGTFRVLSRSAVAFGAALLLASCGAAHAAGPSTSFSIAPFHGKVHLPGTWGNARGEWNYVMHQEIPSQAMLGGVQPKVELSIGMDGRDGVWPGGNGEGGTIFGVWSFPSEDPATVLAGAVTTSQQGGQYGTGRMITEPTRNLTIARYPALAQDFQVVGPNGMVGGRGTVYIVNAGQRIVVIRVSLGAPVQASDIKPFEQALVSIG